MTGVSYASAAVCQAVSDFGSSAPSIIATDDAGELWASEPFPGTVTNFTGISCATSNTAPPWGCRLSARAE